MGNNINFFQRLPEEDKSEINILARRKPVEVKCYEQNKGNALKRPNITIGVLGESHCGKSSFINTARNLKPGDLDAAAVKNQECTMEPAFYDFPDNPNVKLVDLPGVGTNRFQKSNYIEEIEFTKFDFFLIFSKDSFTELDTWLATKLKENNKKFFFVRTFMDNAVREAMFDYNVKVREKDEAGNLTNEMNAFMNQQMEEAKAYSRESLKCSGNEDVPIYCISNYFPDRYEFSKLILDIVAHLLEAQRQVLTFSRNIFSNEALMAKEKILKKQTKYHAALSGLIAAVPTPGVNLLLDVPLIVNTLTSIDQDIEKDYEINPDSPFLKKKYKKISNSIFYC